MMAEDSEMKIGLESGKCKIFLICLGLVLATAIAFEPIRHNDFVRYDDNRYLVKNEYIQDGVTKDSFVWAFTTFHVSNWHPLTWISHMIDYELFGLDPVWHHLVNVLFHICNALLLFIILHRTTVAIWPSAIVAAFFAVHPVHVESVAWAAERKDVLSTFFWLLTMLAYVDYVKKPGLSRYIITLVLFCLGLMAKPMLVTLPVVLLLFDFWPLGRLRFTGSKGINDNGCESVGLWRLILEKIPFFAAAACLAVVTILAQRNAMEVAENMTSSLLIRISNALFSYVAYLGKMLYPKDLAVLYPLQAEGLAFWKPLFAAFLLLLITSALLYAGRKRGWLLTGWLWYLITLLPVIGLIQVGAQAMADRYTYVPSIGFFIIVAWGLGELFQRFRVTTLIRMVLVVGVLAVCVLVTRVQVGYWRNSFTLFGRAIDVTEDNYVMHNNVGAVFFDHGNFHKAAEHFNKSLSINPDFILAKVNIGYLLRRQNKMDEAIECFREVLTVKKDSHKVYNELGMAYAYKKEYGLAIECYKRAIELKADNPDVYKNWGKVLKNMGRMDEAQAKFDKAEQLLQEKASDEETSLIDDDGIGKVEIDDE
jgi:tetratricopeptide (TPR) repeat protein